jgi:hypothetical protein
MILGRYFFLGVGLSFVGTTTSLISYFLAHLVPLTALGIAAIIVGVTAATIPEQVTGSNAMKVLLRGSTLGIDPLLIQIQARRQSNIGRSTSTKENSPKVDNPAPATTSPNNFLLDLEREEEEGEKEENEPLGLGMQNFSGAIYLPPILDRSYAPVSEEEEEEKASVYIPLTDHIPSTMQEMRAAPTRLLSEEDGNDQTEQEGIRLFTPGAYLGQVKEIRTEDTTVEDALHYILVESLEMCNSVRASEVEDTVVVEIDGVRLKSESQEYRQLLGSLPTSLAASVVAIVRGAPVVITNEDITPAMTVARFSILEVNPEN